MSPAEVPRRAHRALAALARIAGGALVVLLALLALADLGLDTAPVRGLVVREVNRVLDGKFRGNLQLVRIGALHWDRASGVDARLTAPDGTVLIDAQGASARVRPFQLLGSLLGRGDLRIDILDADVREAAADLRQGPDGTPLIASAFEPRTQGPAGGPPGKGVRVSVPAFRVERSVVRPSLEAMPRVEAEVDDLRGSLATTPGRVSVDVTRAAVVGRGVPHRADPHGIVEAHLLVPPPSGGAFALVAAFRGDVGGAPAQARAALDEDSIEASADVRDASPEVLGAMVQGWPLRRPVSAHAEARGPWSAVQVTATVTAGVSRAEVAGEVSLRGRLAASATLDARDLDLGALADGPRSDLGVRARASLRTLATGALAGHFAVTTASGSIGDQPVPAAAMTGDFAQPDGRSVHAAARGTIDEPGAPVAFDVDVTTAGPDPRVSFHATSAIPRLEAVPRLRAVGARASGAADLRADGAVRLSDPAALDVALHAGLEHVAVGRYRFAEGQVDARGSASRQVVDVALRGDPSVRGHATLLLRSGLTIADASVAVDRAPAHLDARVDRVRIAGGWIDVDGAHVTGAGSPLDATVHLRPGSFAATASSTGLDLQALGHVLGIDGSLRRGRASFDVRVDARRDGADGRAVVTLDDGCFFGLDGLTGHLDASMAGRALAGSLDARAAGLGSLVVDDMRVQLGGSGPLDLRAWRRMWGRLHVEGDVDLARVAAELPPNTLPLGDVSGHLQLRGHLRRRSPSDAVPDLALSLRTEGLHMAARSAPDRRSDGTVIVAPPRWKIDGVDVSLDASVAGGGLTEVAARLGDAHGAVVAVDAKSDAVPYARLLGSPVGLGAVLARVPFVATASIPDRDLRSLPDVLRPVTVLGSGGATMTFDGSLAQPVVALRAEARAIRLLGARRRAPFDAALTASYDGRAARAVVDVQSGSATLAHAEADLNARVDALLGGAAAWNGSLRAHLDGVPLAAIPLLTDRDLRGEVAGDVRVDGLHTDARAAADLDVTDLRVGKTSYGLAHLHAAFDGARADARVDIEEPDGGGRMLAQAGLVWGARVVPVFDPGQPASVTLQASHLRLGILAPFVERVVEELDGRLDADTRISLAPGQPAALGGSAVLSDGQMAFAPVGQELRAVRGRVTFEPGGIVRITDASAQGTSGKVGVSALAHLEGTRLVDASAEVTIARSDAMPLSVEGTEVGTVYGKAQLHLASPGAGPTSLRVDVPSWHVRLPEASTHGVQDLGGAPAGIHVGTYVARGRFVELPLDGAHAPDSATSTSTGPSLLTEVHLGNDVEVRRGADLRVQLGGVVTAATGGRTALTGQIRLRTGILDVQGKSFEIQGGTVTFTGDPANPMVKVTAAWSAQDGTRVYADYTGPLKTGKVTLRSEPPRPQNEILALVLFGSAEGSTATPYATPQPDAATRAGTTVGSFASGGLSKGIDKLTGMDITAKVDASQANPRPEVAVQLARDISLQLAFVLGTPPPGTNPDTTYATIDWRFLRNWSLETTFGNLGSSIADLVWQKRY